MLSASSTRLPFLLNRRASWHKYPSNKSISRDLRPVIHRREERKEGKNRGKSKEDETEGRSEEWERCQSWQVMGRRSSHALTHDKGRWGVDLTQPPEGQPPCWLTWAATHTHITHWNPSIHSHTLMTRTPTQPTHTQHTHTTAYHTRTRRHRHPSQQTLLRNTNIGPLTQTRPQTDLRRADATTQTDRARGTWVNTAVNLCLM